MAASTNTQESKPSMQQSERIAINIAVTFLRMVTTVGMGLYATRLLLRSLGEIDYGLYGLLGGGAAMFLIIQATLVLSVQRHLAYQIGKEDEEELNAVFSTSILLFFAAALTVVILGAALTPILLNYLNYPEQRETAVLVVWVTTLFAIAVVMVKSPYNAIFMARQAMVQGAFFHVLASLLLLLVAFVVSSYQGDRLILLGVLMLLVRCVEFFVMHVASRKQFEESHVRFSTVRRDLFKELLTFGGWGLLDAAAMRLRQLGGNLILNPFFGPVTNASYSLGFQVQTYEQSLAWTFTRATSPVIIQRYAMKDFDYVRRMILSVSRMSTLFVAAICIPTALEMPYILGIWVGIAPAYATEFCTLMLLTVLAEQLTAGYTSGIQAVGKVAVYYSSTAVATFLPIAVACLVYLAGYGTPPMLVAFVAVGIVSVVFFRAWHVGKAVDIPFLQWVREVVLRVGIVVGASGVLSLFVRESVDLPGIARLMAVFLSYWAIFVPLTWYIGLGLEERKKIKTWIGRACQIVMRS